MIHWQNLNDEPIKKYWLHGRAWIWRMSVCWCLPTEHWMISFGVNGGDSNNELTFSIGVGILALYVSIKFYRFNVGHWSKTLKEKFFIHEEREFDLYYYNKAFWLRLWGDPMGGWSRDMSWHLVSHSFHLDDFFLGKIEYSEMTLKEGDIYIPMPEGSYPAKYKQYIATRKRKRWFKKEIMMVQIDIPNGIPHEGKGENSYDCGEDALYGLTTPANKIEDAVGKVVSSVLNDRKRYGGEYIHRDKVTVMA